MLRLSALAIAACAISSLLPAVQGLPAAPAKGGPAGKSTPPSQASRIAIIGAGAGGSSAAYWISKAQQRWGLNITVDIFEAAGTVGGRVSAIHPYGDSRLQIVEMGATLFTSANLNLNRAVSEFGLDYMPDVIGGVQGVWDGKEYRWTSAGIGGSLTARYGLQSIETQATFTANLLKTVETLYNSTFGTHPWTDFAALASKLGWSDYLSRSTLDYYRQLKISDPYILEIIESGTEGSWGQPVDQVHALSGTIALATDGATSVLGGNWQIFDQFIKASKATLHLNTAVTKVKEVTNAATKKTYYDLTYTPSPPPGTDTSYDFVILAAPYPSGIDFDIPVMSIPAANEYVEYYSTAFTSSSAEPNARYFNLRANDTVPQTALTTFQFGSKPEFTSAAYTRKVATAADNQPADLTQLGIGSAKGRDSTGQEWVIKMLHKDSKDLAWFENVFENVRWIETVSWKAYPRLQPTSSFPPIQLTTAGLYYVNAFEPFISTMETETISSRNIVELLMQEHFQASICRDVTATPGEGYVYGFDC